MCLERGYCPPNQAQRRVFDVGRSYARMIKLQKRFFFQSPENFETNSGQKHSAHTNTLVVFKSTCMMNPHFFVVRFSQNSNTNVTKNAHIMPHNTKKFLI